MNKRRKVNEESEELNEADSSTITNRHEEEDAIVNEQTSTAKT